MFPPRYLPARFYPARYFGVGGVPAAFNPTWARSVNTYQRGGVTR